MQSSLHFDFEFMIYNLFFHTSRLLCSFCCLTLLSHSDTHVHFSPMRTPHHTSSIIEPTRDAVPGLISRSFHPVSTLSKQPRDPQALLRALLQSHASSSFKCHNLHYQYMSFLLQSLFFFSSLFYFSISLSICLFLPL